MSHGMISMNVLDEILGDEGEADDNEANNKGQKNAKAVPQGQSGSGNETTSGSARKKDTRKKLKIRYFVIKCAWAQNIDLSTEHGLWATTKHNEAKLNSAFDDVDRVYLVFSVNNSGNFQGYARMMEKIPGNISEIPFGASFNRTFKVHWEVRQDTPFTLVNHLTNPWNENKPVRISRDCQELPPEVGKELALAISKEYMANKKSTPKRRAAGSKRATEEQTGPRKKTKAGGHGTAEKVGGKDKGKGKEGKGKEGKGQSKKKMVQIKANQKEEERRKERQRLEEGAREKERSLERKILEEKKREKERSIERKALEAQAQAKAASIQKVSDVELPTNGGKSDTRESVNDKEVERPPLSSGRVERGKEERGREERRSDDWGAGKKNWIPRKPDPFPPSAGWVERERRDYPLHHEPHPLRGSSRDARPVPDDRWSRGAYDPYERRDPHRHQPTPRYRDYERQHHRRVYERGSGGPPPLDYPRGSLRGPPVTYHREYDRDRSRRYRPY